MKNFLAQGVITPPNTIPTLPPEAGGDPSEFVGGFIQAGIQLLLIVAFIIALFWTIFAGFRFMTSGGDPKSTGAAWSSIYWGLIGMIIVFSSFAIMRMIEAFFGVTIISGSFLLPTGSP